MADERSKPNSLSTDPPSAESDLQARASEPAAAAVHGDSANEASVNKASVNDSSVNDSSVNEGPVNDEVTLQLSEEDQKLSEEGGATTRRGPHRQPFNQPQPQRLPRRRIRLPIILFLLTCLSTFFVGMTQWSPLSSLADCTTIYGAEEFSLIPLRQQFLSRWGDGLLYMLLVMSILLAHEMGHFLFTLVYRVPASLPIFLPFPLNPLGTFGAVIGMQGTHADRKQIFDIGIAGPIAGLVVAIPVMWIGVSQLDLTLYPSGTLGFQCPLATRWMMEYLQPTGYAGQTHVWIGQLNPFFAAGWIGFLITGINMMPISQLDGGHVTYTLFGKSAHWIARATMTLAIAFMVFNSAPTMLLMVILLLLVGTDHPPTRDDHVKIGWFRFSLGFASLAIPILCFPPLIFKW